MLNIPLIILLLLVGGLLLIANMKSTPVVKAKEKVALTIDKVSKSLNNSANNGDKADS